MKSQLFLDRVQRRELKMVKELEKCPSAGSMRHLALLIWKGRWTVKQKHAEEGRSGGSISCTFRSACAVSSSGALVHLPWRGLHREMDVEEYAEALGNTHVLPAADPSALCSDGFSSNTPSPLSSQPYPTLPLVHK